MVPPENCPQKNRIQEAVRKVFQATEIEHMVPRSSVICNEWYNLTVTRARTNSEKNNKTPYDYVISSANKDKQKQLLKNAEEIFGKDSLKYNIFTSPNARKLIDSKRNLNRTSYIARCARYVCLLRFGWLDDNGRDPINEPNHQVNRRYLVSNGGITHRLRKAWNLNELLHDNPLSKEEWSHLGDEEKNDINADRRRKNRQDLRHHAIDAMVLSCTLPWAANSPVSTGGWFYLNKSGSFSELVCRVFGPYFFV